MHTTCKTTETVHVHIHIQYRYKQRIVSSLHVCVRKQTRLILFPSNLDLFGFYRHHLAIFPTFDSLHTVSCLSLSSYQIHCIQFPQKNSLETQNSLIFYDLEEQIICTSLCSDKKVLTFKQLKYIWILFTPWSLKEVIRKLIMKYQNYFQNFILW